MLLPTHPSTYMHMYQSHAHCVSPDLEIGRQYMCAHRHRVMLLPPTHPPTYPHAHISYHLLQLCCHLLQLLCHLLQLYCHLLQLYCHLLQLGYVLFSFMLSVPKYIQILCPYGFLFFFLVCPHGTRQMHPYCQLLQLADALFSFFVNNVNTYIYIHMHIHIYLCIYIHIYMCDMSCQYYGVATISRLLEIIGLFCKRAL